MADYAAEVALEDAKLGDRWVGIPTIGPVLINGSQPAEALVRVRMHLRNRAKGLVFRCDSDATTNPDAPITIVNATTWEAKVPVVQSFVSEAGQWDWDMEFYSEGNTGPLTLYRGELVVLADVTRTQA